MKRGWHGLGIILLNFVCLWPSFGTALASSDETFEKAIKRCDVLGYPEKSDSWRGCVVEQLLLIAGEVQANQPDEPKPERHNENSPAPIERPQEQSTEPTSPSTGSFPVSSVPPAEVEVPYSRSQEPQLSERGPVTPPKLKKSMTANENRACFSGYVGSPVALTYVVEIGVDGRATLVDWPEANPKSAKKAVQCALSKEEYEPATQDGRPVSAQVRQGITIGRAHRPSELPKVTVPKFSGFDLKEANRCYPGSFKPSGEVEVEVDVVVDKLGRVSDSRVTSLGVPAAVVPVAECLAKTSLFEPGTIKGKASAMTVNLKIAVKT